MFPSLWTNIWPWTKKYIWTTIPAWDEWAWSSSLELPRREHVLYYFESLLRMSTTAKCFEFFGRRSGIQDKWNRGLWDRDIKQDFFPRLNWEWFVNYCLSFIFFYQLWLHEYCWLEKQTNQTVEKIVMEKIVMCVRLVGWIAVFFKYFFKILVIETFSPFIA